MSKVSADVMVERSFGNDEPIDYDQFSKKKNRKSNGRAKMNPLNISEDYIIHGSNTEQIKQ